MITLVGVGVLGTRVLERLSEYERVQLIDFDIVEEKNLHRQYPPAALGMRKVDAAKQFLRNDVQIVHKHVDWSTAGLLHDSAYVIDCTDNVLVRTVINDYCAKFGIPWIHAGLSDTLGTVATIVPGGPCFSCIYPRVVGETCGPALDLALADRVASVIVSELIKLEKHPEPRFLRIAARDATVLVPQKRKGCLTCAGKYEALTPREFYITFCTTAGCMSAKPVQRIRHDRGPADERVVDGIPVRIFANGEVHFPHGYDHDVLNRVANKIFSERKGTAGKG